MKIIIAGGGKVGMALAQQLTSEGHDLTLIDMNSAVLESAQVDYDAMTVFGNCAAKDVLLQAGVETSDLLIAATNADEVNLLSCMTGHGLNPKLHTIARIRNPIYADQIMTMHNIFPLSLAVNPEKQTAMEIERLLKYPGFLRRDTFAKGRVEIVELRVGYESKLKNVSLMELSSVINCRVLVCAVLRNGEAVAPKGDFILREGDRLFVTAPTADLTVLLKNLGIITRRVRRVLLCGGGRVSYYLASLLEKDKIHVQILEKDPERCVELAKLLPETSVILGDCSNHSTLADQGLADCDALVSLTGMDETNMLISFHANAQGVPKTITKLSRSENFPLASSMSLGSVVCPKELCSNVIVRYVRAMQNQTGAAISVHTIADGQVEAVEFTVDKFTRNCNVPLKKIKLKRDILIASITRGTATEIPNGDSEFTQGDSVVVVTSRRGYLHQINDIFA